MRETSLMWVLAEFSTQRVLIANSNLVPEWANWEHFEKLKEETFARFWYSLFITVFCHLKLVYVVYA